MKTTILVRVLAVALALVCLAAGLLPGCAGPAKATAWVEAMPEEEFESLRLKAGLLARVAAARAVSEGAVDPSKLIAAADAFDAFALDPTSTISGSLLSGVLKRAGLTDDEVLLAAVLVEDFARGRFSWGQESAYLGLNARALIRTVAGSLRAGVQSTVTADEIAEAEALVQGGE